MVRGLDRMSPRWKMTLAMALCNLDLKVVDFGLLLAMAGDNAFMMSPTRWIDEINAACV